MDKATELSEYCNKLNQNRFRVFLAATGSLRKRKKLIRVSFPFFIMVLMFLRKLLIVEIALLFARVLYGNDQ